MARDYDSAVARIAGNIAGHYFHSSLEPETIARRAVNLARLIVQEVKRTEPQPEWKDR